MWEQIAAMNVEIGEREFARDREYFEKRLATAFAKQRANSERTIARAGAQRSIGSPGARSWTKAIDYTRLSSDGSWKFTTTAPPAGWEKVAFDDRPRHASIAGRLSAVARTAMWTSQLRNSPPQTLQTALSLLEGVGERLV